MHFSPPEPLERHHRLDSFTCTSLEQTLWLTQHARASHAGRTTRVQVVTPVGSDDVVAYYAWCMASVDRAQAPRRLTAGSGRYPQPVALLARLAVHDDAVGRGLGAALLRDAMARLVTMSDDIGCRALLVHAESNEARAFYLHVVPEFEPSPTDPLHLVLMVKDIRASLGLSP